jgi:X-Pro dipeptidyl-peptidase
MRRRGWSAALVALALVAVGLVPSGASAQKPSKYKTAVGKSQPKYDEYVTEEYRVETEHGTIYGEVKRPVVPEGVEVPVILTYSPYNVLKSPSPLAGSTADDSVADYFVPRGYARAVFDLVGTRESSGCYDYGGIAERETGAAVVDYLGERSWSNGRVGMIGGSYEGITQLAAAVETPEHLKAIISQVAIDRWYDYAYGGGIRYFLNTEHPTDEGFDTPLAFDFGFGLLPPTDPTQTQFVEAIRDHISPCERIQHTGYGYDPDPLYDDFWRERDYRRRAAQVEAAVLLGGGWLDHNVKHWDTTRFFMALPDSHPKKLAIGQWNHSASQFEDAQDLRHAFFDRWLLGLNTGIMELPRVDTELNTGKRIQTSDWPPPGTERVKVPLSREPGRGALALQGSGAPAWSDLDPALTEDEALAGACGERCILFRSRPLERGVRVSGGPVLRLRATTDAESTHLVPVLFDEAPDGEREIVSRGFLNTGNRGGLGISEPLEPGQPYTAPVPIWDTDYLVRKGHRLGVAVMSSNAAWALPEDDSRATTRLTLGGESVLDLPISAGDAALRPTR